MLRLNNTKLLFFSPNFKSTKLTELKFCEVNVSIYILRKAEKIRGESRK